MPEVYYLLDNNGLQYSMELIANKTKFIETTTNKKVDSNKTNAPINLCSQQFPLYSPAYGDSKCSFTLGTLDKSPSTNPSYQPDASVWAVQKWDYLPPVYIQLNSEDGTIGTAYAGSIKFSEIINHVKGCLMEGTQILMADNTYKNVEDVQIGDLIMGYDLVKHEKIPAVAIYVARPGTDHDFVANTFDNGTVLYTHDVHRVYVPTETASPCRDIRHIEDGTLCLDENGNTVAFADRIGYNSGYAVGYYNIISSCGLYFANGIMNANHPGTKAVQLSKVGIEIPENIKVVWDKDVEGCNNTWTNNPEYQKESAELLHQIATHDKAIRMAKARLNETDYINMKHSEGLIDEETWESAKREREAWREIINTNEGPLAEKRVQLKAIRDKYKPDEFVLNEHEKFVNSNQRNIEIYDLYRQWRPTNEERKQRYEEEMARRLAEQEQNNQPEVVNEETENSEN